MSHIQIVKRVGGGNTVFIDGHEVTRVVSCELARLDGGNPQSLITLVIDAETFTIAREPDAQALAQFGLKASDYRG